MKVLSDSELENVSAGLLFLIAMWAASHNGGAYTEDRGAGAWG